MKVPKWWPLMLRSTCEKKCADLKDAHHHLVQQKDKDNDGDREVLRRLIESLRLVRITQPEGINDCYQFQTRIDRHLIEKAFMHGNSEPEIRYISDLIGHQAGQMLRAGNFFRPTHKVTY